MCSIHFSYFHSYQSTSFAYTHTHNLLSKWCWCVCMWESTSTCDELGTSFLWSVRVHVAENTNTCSQIQNYFSGYYCVFDCSNLIIVAMNECHSHARTYPISDARQFFALRRFYFFFGFYFTFFKLKIESHWWWTISTHIHAHDYGRGQNAGHGKEDRLEQRKQK